MIRRRDATLQMMCPKDYQSWKIVATVATEEFSLSLTEKYKHVKQDTLRDNATVSEKTQTFSANLIKLGF